MKILNVFMSRAKNNLFLYGLRYNRFFENWRQYGCRLYLKNYKVINLIEKALTVVFMAN